MPDSRPGLFDDGGGLPEVDRSHIGDRPPVQEPREHADGRHPNYLARRAIAVGTVVALVAGGAVGVGALLRNGGDGSGGTLDSPAWNTVVAMETSSGTVVLTDDAGAEASRFRLGIQRLTDARLVSSTIVALTSDKMAVASLKRPDEIATIDIEATGGLSMPSGSASTVIAHDASSQRAVFVHGPSAEMIDTDALDAVVGARYDLDLARSSPSGRNVLVTDAGNFQSVLFSFDRDQPSFFPGLALAVDDTQVVTAQNVGTSATISVFDHAGQPGVSATTSSVRAGMLVNDGLVLVTVSGEVLTMSLASGEVSSDAQLDIGTVAAGHVAPRGDRLVVVGDAGTAIVNDSGAVIADLPGAIPTDNGIDQLAPRRTRCLITARADDGAVVVVDLDDGAIVAEAIASPVLLAGVDGCEPVIPTATGYLVITADGVRRATLPGDVVGISPDGHTLVVDNANRLELVRRVLDDGTADESEPVDIGPSRRSVFFADL